MEIEKVKAYMERQGMSEEGKRGYLEMVKTRMDERVAILRRKLEKTESDLRDIGGVLKGGKEK